MNLILSEKKPAYVKVSDIMETYDCGRDTAYKIIREIKKYRDRLKIKGRVLYADWAEWSSVTPRHDHETA